MSTFLAEGYEWHGDGGYLENETLSNYLAEYKSQSRAFKENITLQWFFRIKENQRPRHSNRRKGHIHNRSFLPTFDRSSTSTTKAWMKELDDLFQLHPVTEREATEIAVTHLEGGAKD